MYNGLPVLEIIVYVDLFAEPVHVLLTAWKGILAMFLAPDGSWLNGREKKRK
jgi:hypothetical protein